VLWACPSQYVRDVVVPEVTTGRNRAGKSIAGFHILAAVPSAMTHDRATALAGVRNELHRYFGLPFYRAMFQAAGFAGDVAAFDAASPDVDAQKLAISERFIDDLCAIGDEAAVRDGVQRYRDAGVTNPVLTAILGTDFEPTLRAAASAIASTPVVTQ
jgi:hypothetical protein